jgi:hypothetical protein
VLVLVAVTLWPSACFGVAAVAGVTMSPTVGSAAAVLAVAGLGLHGSNLGCQLRLGGVGRGLDACHSQRVFHWRWNGCGWRRRRCGDRCCGVSSVVSHLAGSQE